MIKIFAQENKLYTSWKYIYSKYIPRLLREKKFCLINRRPGIVAVKGYRTLPLVDLSGQVR